MIDTITVRGFVATDVKSSTTTGGVAAASFRMASNVRRFDPATQTWVDGHTNWYEVQAYRQMAGNVSCSLRKGQPVIVVGRMKVRSWEYEGRNYFVIEIDADSIGQDLKSGTANYTKNPTRPVMSLMEQDSADDADAENRGSGTFQPSPDGEDPGAQGFEHDVLVEDTDGALSTLDLETGELAGNRA